MPLGVTATEFAKNFGRYQRHAHKEPIQVRSHGEIAGYWVSPETFERLERLVMASRRAYHPSELPSHLAAALADARMGEEHAHLDSLMGPD